LAPAVLFTLVIHDSTHATPTAFYRETKWCDACSAQVRYLASVDHSFCVQCGGRVRLFATDERARIAEAAQRHRYQAV
jgi:rRNA maturation endonuclease Nob1